MIAALVGLLALVCVVIGVVSTLALRDFLVGQLDAQLRAAADRTSHAFESPPRTNESDDDDDPGPGFLTTPGQAAGTLGAWLRPGHAPEVAVLDEAGERQHVPNAAVTVLVGLPTDGEPHSRDLGSLGAYRLLAFTAPDGDTLITGLPLSGVTETAWRMTAVAAAVAVFGLLAAGTLGAVVVRRSLRPLRRVAGTATQVAEVPLDRGAVALSVRVPPGDTDPRTEVGQVGSALNGLLGHVSAALAARHESEMRVRQFVADASHELRTPLSAIRGYAEVTRRSGDGVPPEIAHALRRIESETVRMTTLVDDLLLLARLDAGRPLAADPVDLTALIVDAVSDAHVAGPEHRWLLDLPEDPVTLTGDAERLHQVFANLLANARTHTPPGTIVSTTLAAANGAAVVTVTDNGPGIAPDLLPEVFERFARGDTSRSRAAGSTGLGLAIVSAVVEAHHGGASVESRPGHTAFTVTLPLWAPEARSPDGTDRTSAGSAAHIGTGNKRSPEGMGVR